MGVKRTSHTERKGGELDPEGPTRQTADSLARFAIESFMRMHDVDFETAQRWIVGAAVAQVENIKPAPNSRKVR